MSKYMTLLSAGVTAAALAGCGGGNGATTAAAVAGLGPGISVLQAKDYTGTEPVLVNGFVVYRRNEQPRLCTSLGESDPPQCGEPSLTIDAPELDDLGLELQSKDGLQWSAKQVQIVGHVRGGDTLFVEEAER